jgi:hypothetical protein
MGTNPGSQLVINQKTNQVSPRVLHKLIPKFINIKFEITSSLRIWFFLI